MAKMLPQFNLQTAKSEMAALLTLKPNFQAQFALSLMELIMSERAGNNPHAEAMLKRVLMICGYDAEKVGDILYGKAIPMDIMMDLERLGKNPEGKDELDAYKKLSGLISQLPLNEQLDILEANNQLFAKSNTPTLRPQGPE